MTKKIYIYDDVHSLTDSWHDGGGCLIITAGKPQAAMDAYQSAAAEERLADIHPPKEGTSEQDIQWYHHRIAACKPLECVLPAPLRVIGVAGAEEDAVIIFPDQGCC